MNLKCVNCGKTIESLSTSCGYSISYDSLTGEWGCFLDNCGFIVFSKFLCENCCTNRR